MNNSPLSNDSLLESTGNIVKASNADVYAEQVLKLKISNIKLIEALETLIEAIPKQNDDYDWWEDSLTTAVEDAKEEIKKATIISL
jgi:hypothetical protein